MAIKSIEITKDLSLAGRIALQAALRCPQPTAIDGMNVCNAVFALAKAFEIPIKTNSPSVGGLAESAGAATTAECDPALLTEVER